MSSHDGTCLQLVTLGSKCCKPVEHSGSLQITLLRGSLLHSNIADAFCCIICFGLSFYTAKPKLDSLDFLFDRFYALLELLYVCLSCTDMNL